MKTINKKKKLCLVCMEEHDVSTVEVTDTEEFKGEEVSFNAIYEYCENADEYLETENMIKANSLAMKDVYREKMGLLTSNEIIAIREKYDVSQKVFSDILDWGKATIARYENHQVQNRAHDDILRKIDSDPKWTLQMINRAEGKIPKAALSKALKAANAEFRKKSNQYLIDSIQALYSEYTDKTVTGGVNLNLNKVVEIINYYALKVSSLHKVKLMKMLWYGDNLNYKRTGNSITGLVYSCLPMGAVPQGCEQIIDLEGVNFETIIYDCERTGYKFYPAQDFKLRELSKAEINVLDSVISEVGSLNSQDIINKMHAEDAYQKTGSNCIIPYTYAKYLSID